MEILEGPSPLHKTQGHQRDVSRMVRESNEKVMESSMEEDCCGSEIMQAKELRGRLKDIVFAFGCTFSFDKVGVDSVSSNDKHVDLVW